MTSAIDETNVAGVITKLTVTERHWTGGQYSLFRVLLAAYVMAHIAAAFWQPGAASLHGLTGPLMVGAALLSAGLALLLAAGTLDRTAALLLAAIHGWLHIDATIALVPGEAVITFILLAHTAMPTAPYGSWQALGRSDPDAGWRMPAWVATAAWIALLVTLAASLLAALTSFGWLATGLVLPILWFGRHRWAIWAVAAALMIGAAPFSSPSGPLLPLMLLLLVAGDPAWIPARHRPATGVLFFDGNCALCHGAVRFLLAEDRDERFTFSPIGGERFTRTLPKDAIAGLPDSMILVTDTGDTLLKSDAVIACLHGLGGLWRIAAPVCALFPRAIRDHLYDLIGSRRYRLFGTKAEICPLMTAAQRRRFQP